MTYYRLAFQKPHTTVWSWKSTVITSLSSAIQLLRLYRAYPQDRMRMFTASSKETLSEMLRLENTGLASGSVTVEQFLRERKLLGGNNVRAVPEVARIESTMYLSPANVSSSSSEATALLACLSGERSMSELEKKRLEMELGPGGDHNQAYLFSFPASIPQVQAWMRLRARVQAGEFHPF